MNSEDDIDAAQLASGAGVPHGELLVRFTDASYGDPTELKAVRDEVVAAMGRDAMVDAAAVVANFHMMTRIADGTGTPLDGGSVEMSEELRQAIGVDDFDSRRFDPAAQ